MYSREREKRHPPPHARRQPEHTERQQPCRDNGNDSEDSRHRRSFDVPSSVATWAHANGLTSPVESCAIGFGLPRTCSPMINLGRRRRLDVRPRMADFEYAQRWMTTHRIARPGIVKLEQRSGRIGARIFHFYYSLGLARTPVRQRQEVCSTQGLREGGA